MMSGIRSGGGGVRGVGVLPILSIIEQEIRLWVRKSFFLSLFFPVIIIIFFLFITREGRRIGRDAVIIGEASTWHPLWIRMSENCQNTQMEVSEPTFETV